MKQKGRETLLKQNRAKRKKKHNAVVKVYQFVAKFNSSILVATLLARATPTEHTNPFEL